MSKEEEEAERRRYAQLREKREQEQRDINAGQKEDTTKPRPSSSQTGKGGPRKNEDD